jgi:hypothetical protein
MPMSFYEMADNIKPAYTAVVLNQADRVNLLGHFQVPQGWEALAHHMTINMGAADQGPAAQLLGQDATLQVVAQAQDEFVMAVKVESLVPSKNATKHITVAVNRAGGGKPVMSNQLANWQACSRSQRDGEGRRGRTWRRRAPYAEAAALSFLSRSSAQERIVLAMSLAIQNQRCRVRCNWRRAAESVRATVAAEIVVAIHSYHPRPGVSLRSFRSQTLSTR